MPVCTQPFDTLVINVDGDVVLCCSDMTGRLVNWGSINDAPVSTVFTGELATAFLKAFTYKAPSICRKCPYKGGDVF